MTMTWWRVVFNPVMNKHVATSYPRFEDVIDYKGDLKKGVFRSARQAHAVADRLNKEAK
jgi:hypothetical protein